MNRRTQLIVASAIVFVCAVLPWAGTLDYPFLHDDRMAVTDNPLLQGPGVDVHGILTTTGWGDIPEYGHVANYRPLSLLTVAATRAAAGLDPVPFRVTNVLVYAAACLMLMALLVALGIRPAIAGIAASWFALHGTHVESVMFIVNREILFATFFYLAGLLIVVRRSAFVDRPAVWGPGALIGLGLVALAGMLCKESAVTMPFAAAAVAVMSRPAGVPVRKRLAPAAVLCGSVAAYLAIRFIALGKLTASVIPWQDNPLVLSDTPARLAGSMKVLLEAARLLVLPHSMTVDYGFDVLGLPGAPPGAPPAVIVAGALLLVATTILLAVLVRRRSAAWIGLAVMAVSYGLVSSIVFPSWIILGERLLTEPSAGLAIALAVGTDVAVTRLSTRQWQKWLAVSLCALFVVWAAVQGALSMDRIPDYRNAESLFQSSLANRPGSTRLHNNIGQVMMESGRWAEAEPYFRAAIAIDPANAEAHNNLGLVLANAGRPAAGATELLEALKHRPNMPAALNNLCILLVNHADYKSALPICEKAVERGGKVSEQLERARAGVAAAPTVAQ